MPTLPFDGNLPLKYTNCVLKGEVMKNRKIKENGASSHRNCSILLQYIKSMKVNLLSCDAQRPDSRAIAACITAISSEGSASVSHELATLLLEGETVTIEVANKNTGSALRALRKLDIDYDIQE